MKIIHYIMCTLAVWLAPLSYRNVYKTKRAKHKIVTQIRTQDTTPRKNTVFVGRFRI